MKALAILLLSLPVFGQQQGHRVPVLPQTTGGGVELISTGGVRTWRASWLHDTDGAGPLEPIVIEVSYEPKPGETATQAASKFANDLEAAKDQFPPNVRQSP
jgi:hypothetical protein